jgi:hypothetical protein
MDYSKYLGKEWTCKFGGAGIAVMNHQNMCDGMNLTASAGRFSIVGNKSLFNSLPGFGRIAVALDILLFERDTKAISGERNNLLKLIESHAIQAEKGER